MYRNCVICKDNHSSISVLNIAWAKSQLSLSFPFTYIESHCVTANSEARKHKFCLIDTFVGLKIIAFD